LLFFISVFLTCHVKRSIGVPSSRSYATKWIITLYSCILDVNSTVTLWDAFLLEGWDFMLGFTVSVLSGNQDELLKCAEVDDVMMLLEKAPTTKPVSDFIGKSYMYK